MVRNSKVEIVVGQRFGRLSILKELGKRVFPSGSYRRFEAICDCGRITEVALSAINSGRTKSCGCLRIEIVKERLSINIPHYKRLRSIWTGMVKRCENKECKAFNRYGGRGIVVCDEWRNDFNSFYDWSINNGYNPKLTIDRSNNDGNYEPQNCLWSTYKQQGNNTRSNHYITYNGETHTMMQWSEKLNINYYVLRARLHYKWSIEKALTTPVIVGQKLKSKSLHL